MVSGERLSKCLHGLFQLLLFAPWVSGQDLPTWTLKPFFEPRSLHAMAYDAARGETVLFGGGAAGGPGSQHNDTWVWDGSVWTRKTPAASPPGRYGHAMAYDAARGEVVLFGGVSSSGVLGDTWIWNGLTWIQKNLPTSPSARSQHKMAYDAARGVIVLFGGTPSTYPAETWVWDGSTWTKKSPAVSPLGRSSFDLTYDEGRKQVVLFGGVLGGNQPLNDTWVWDGISWAQKSPAASPPPTYSHSLIYDSHTGVTVLFGGYNNTGSYAGMWLWNGSSWTQMSTATGPAGRKWHSGVYDSARERLVLYGGYCGYDLGDTWEWDGAGWTQTGWPAAPSPREYSAMTYDAGHGQVVLFGGSGGGTMLQDTWLWNGEKWLQRFPAMAPFGRMGAAIVYDVARAQTVLFGGHFVSSSQADTWLWDGSSWTQKFTSPYLTGRGDHSMVYDDARRVVTVFGGLNTYSGETFSDTLTWNGTGWTKMNVVTSPQPRFRQAMAFDSARGQAVLFGGTNTRDERFGDTWIWDGSEWTQKFPVVSPPPRSGHSMVYDSARGHVLLFGGYGLGGKSYSDTWVWDGANWTQLLPATAPSARFGHGAAYHEARKQVILFGGEIGYRPVGGTWVWPTSCSYALSPYSLTISDPPLSGTISVAPSSPDCTWSASASSTGWLQLTAGLTGTGPGQVSFSVSANTSGTLRTGTITIGGQVFTLNQDAARAGYVPFSLQALLQCWPGSSQFPAGPGIQLQWADQTWATSYEISRDGQVIAVSKANTWTDVKALVPGHTYAYQVRAMNSSGSALSAKATATAPANCPTLSSPVLENVIVSKDVLASGQSSGAKVRLTSPALVGGALVTLSSSSPNVSVPASVLIPGGETAATFQVSAANILSSARVTIAATYATSSATTFVEVKPLQTSTSGVAYLLLHGLNSDPYTWEDFVEDWAPGGYCDGLTITAEGAATEDKQFGAVNWTFWKNRSPNGCYALHFSRSSVAGETWENGDGLTFDELGAQVAAAVKHIKDKRDPAAIVFIGHSRGGLAARAYLQQFASPDQLSFRVGLITIGTPHRGSPAGRIKPWMDQNGYSWNDTLQQSTRIMTAIADLSPGLVTPLLARIAAYGTGGLREELKFLFSPSTGYLASSHDSSGEVQLCGNTISTALCDLNSMSSNLGSVVASSGQVISYGMTLGDNIYGPFNLLYSTDALSLDVGGVLPGDEAALRSYVFENLSTPTGLSWRQNSDSIVPASSQRLDAIANFPVPPVTVYLDKIRHIDETKQAICIKQVLNGVVSQPGFPQVTSDGAGSPADSVQTSTLEEPPRPSPQSPDIAVSLAQSRVRLLRASGLVEAALEGDRLNTLEGVISRREIRQREWTDQVEIAGHLRRSLNDPSPEVRAGAAELLTDLPVELAGAPVIELLWRERDEVVRQAAFRSLQRLAAQPGTPASRAQMSQNLQWLAESATGDPELFFASIAGLVALGGSEQVELLKMFHDQLGSGRRAVIRESLRALRNGEGAARLGRYLEADPELQQEWAHVSGDTLAAMSTVESVQGLVGWAAMLPEGRLAATAAEWMRQVRTTAAKVRLNELLVAGEFRSDEVRTSLQDVARTAGECAAPPAVPIP